MGITLKNVTPKNRHSSIKMAVVSKMAVLACSVSLINHVHTPRRGKAKLFGRNVFIDINIVKID